MKYNSIALIACSGRKSPSKNLLPASIRYQGTLFKFSKLFADRFCGGHYFILSAKYGLLSPTQMIPWYNISLASYSTKQRRDWAEKVISVLASYKISHIYIYTCWKAVLF